MIHINSFLESLSAYLVDSRDISNNVVRKHTRKLEQLGDVSFPTDIKNWRNLIQTTDESLRNIFEYAAQKHGASTTEKLLEASSAWCLHISRCVQINTDIHIFLERPAAFACMLHEVLHAGTKFGSSNLAIDQKLHLKAELAQCSKVKLNLSELRALLICNVTTNLLRFTNCLLVDEDSADIQVVFTLKSNSGSRNLILCGPVLNDKGLKNSLTTTEDLYRKRTIDMRLMAEHKYGMRITAQPGWQDFFEKLGEAAVIIELLQNKPSNATTISLVDATLSNSKGASFILYNCARLATLLKEFGNKVSSGIYPSLPAFDSIDFSLLNQPEEWELLYVHIMQFPITISNTVKHILVGKVNPHNLTLTLSSLCSVFSVYYRRVRILTEPKTHLYPILFARIYLLKAVEQVLHNGLLMLDIRPVKQM